MKRSNILIVFTLTMAFAACNSKPKVIEAEQTGEAAPAPIFQDVPKIQGNSSPAQDLSTAMHEVTVEEKLDTDKYSYLRVKENDEEYWIAISKRDVEIGETYIFTGGIIKKNFQSREYNRIFETLYLVSDFRDSGGGDDSAIDQAFANAQGGMIVEPPKEVTPAAGAVRISDLVKNLQKYEGKSVKVTGKVMKINPMIMGRNWVHLQDGSGKDLELTVTTTDQVQTGSIVTLEGVFALNKDFGAGYRYDYILESARLK